MYQRQPDAAEIPTRILITGSDLLSGALANALETYGFATLHIAFWAGEIERGIEWGPDLVIIEARSLDITAGTSTVAQLRGLGLQVCVIDSADVGNRFDAWITAGTSAFVDRSEPFTRLFATINRLLQNRSASPRVTGSDASLPITAADERNDPVLGSFATLTQREMVVLAELIEGHSAEQIAKAAVVSISTVRSQIRAILQKLGVNSQLAAVAMARRAGWSLDSQPRHPHLASGNRHSRVS